MRTLMYEGPATVRLLGPADGMTTTIRFDRMVPTEVADANAAAIMGDPDRFGRFREVAPDDAGDTGSSTDQAAAGGTDEQEG